MFAALVGSAFGWIGDLIDWLLEPWDDWRERKRVREIEKPDPKVMAQLRKRSERLKRIEKYGT